MSENFNKSLYIIPIGLLFFYAVYSVFNMSIKPTQSTYQRALVHNEVISKPLSPVKDDAKESSTPLTDNILSEEDYINKFALDQNDFERELSHIEQTHTGMIEKMKRSDITISRINLIKPRLRYAIALFLDINPATLTSEDIDYSNISSTHLYLLKKFSQSNDFRILLRRGELRADYLSFDNLKKHYQN